ncbi:alpha/beta hydrolase [Arthrobacter psychrolactophilus]|uniref:Alpha/beta hydrolase n=1 Tax=Arthrobacter psychrolactophilus TaxID=92442 RepID=A0A2V5IR89_9MICC|nr:alpha/beta hydrolase [Arthrobacter psychrolactophilus]PYI37892.1 alpha/beta hydrolase [Arthrobacter psychrolactophilus]
MPTAPVRRRHRLILMAAASIGALLLSSCSVLAPDKNTETSASAEIVGDVPAALMDFYTQPVTWSSCNGGYQCAEVKVPLNYDKPSSDSIKLSAIRLPATGKRLGAMLINPGGPGGSGVNMVKDGGKSYFSAKLRGAYDIVGFDPRGVQRSAGVKCLDDAQMDAARQVDFDLSTDAGLAAADAETKTQTELCQQNSGSELGHIDTVSSAKDMDILRAIAGDKQLNYMGFSYGTKLGATYAGLFPDRVGKFSLDGAMDPSLDIDEVSMGQAVGFENALRAWVANCLTGSDCPVSGTVDEAMVQIQTLQAVYTATPQQTPEGRVVTGTEFTGALAFAMYSTDLWEPLKAALAQAFAGDASGMLMLADYSADRDSSGVYNSNTSAAFTAINCLDYSMNWDPAHMREQAELLKKAAPTFGDLLSYSGLSCKYWPVKATGTQGAISASGAGPILVIGTTGDPATPYVWAEALANQLDSGVLVTWTGEGHTAYGRSNECITSTVDDYFVDGKVPAAGTSC